MEQEVSGQEEQYYQEDKTLKKELLLKINDPKSSTLFNKITSGLKKTKDNFVVGLKQSLVGEKELDEGLFDEIEGRLLSADIGVPTTRRVLELLKEEYQKGSIKTKQDAFVKIVDIFSYILSSSYQPLQLENDPPTVVLFVGVNGVGKTTTIGKVAAKFVRQSKKVLVAAGDTFRTGAIEQVRICAQRANADVFYRETGSDAAATVYMATEKAIKQKYDILLCDTSGRLNTNKALMLELQKIKKSIKKNINIAPHYTILVLDATTGQNAISQVREFKELIGIDALIVTKIDGSARGGVLVGLINEFKLPVYYVGLGEKIDDLRDFEPKVFAKALFADN